MTAELTLTLIILMACASTALLMWLDARAVRHLHYFTKETRPLPKMPQNK